MVNQNVQLPFTPVFCVTWSFRNHANMPDLLLKKHVLLLSMLKEYSAA